MTRVDFYILPQEDSTIREHMACRLTEKAVSRGHQVYLHLQNSAQASRLDDMLWDFRPEAFIPHNGENAAVQIGGNETPDPTSHHHDVLINLTTDVPTFFSRYHRVIEVVNQQADILSASRENWKFYQNRGYPLQSHRL